MEPKIYLQSEHGIDINRIDSDALFVIDKLRHAGFTAYLVGGGVRDLLCNRQPKDFDISTSARPEEIKRVFGRRCILIGRRFRLAHVRFGKKAIEVSTFRAGDPECEELIVRDNVWGTPEEDAYRRDFTINGLFYDPSHKSVIDYVGGWDDLKAGLITSIGNPQKRFQQDPVRMIRLLKFQARFDWKIEEKTLQAMIKSRKHITHSAPARILEEFLRMLESGASAKFLKLIQEHHFLELLFPNLHKILSGKWGEEIFHYLSKADDLHLDQSPKTLERAVLLSCLLYPAFENQIKKLEQLPNLGEITLHAGTLIHEVLTSSFSHFPKRLRASVGFILTSQFRITPLGKRRVSRHQIMRHAEFPMVLRFFKVRSLVDSKLKAKYDEWKELYHKREHHGERRPQPRRAPRRIHRRRQNEAP